jgi:hypothetical protein
MRILPILAVVALAGGLGACTSRTTYVERPTPAPAVVTQPPATVVTPAPPPTVTVRPTY